MNWPSSSAAQEPPEDDWDQFVCSHRTRLPDLWVELLSERACAQPEPEHPSF